VRLLGYIRVGPTLPNRPDREADGMGKSGSHSGWQRTPRPAGREAQDGEALRLVDQLVDITGLFEEGPEQRPELAVPDSLSALFEVGPDIHFRRLYVDRALNGRV